MSPAPRFDRFKKIKVRVPASTSNLGPGFDVLGMALKLYCELELTVARPDLRRRVWQCIKLRLQHVEHLRCRFYRRFQRLADTGHVARLR